MSENYDVVIIGGGIIGSSIAYYLAKEKFGRIAIVEKEQYLGNGATAKCAGGIRAQFSSEINVRMSILSEDRFESFADELNCDAHFEQVGYLFLVSTSEAEIRYRTQLEMWQRLGHPCEWLSPRQIKELAPAVKTSDIIGGTFSPRDGIGDPHQFTQGYINSARRLGVEFLLETEATGFQSVGDSITGVETSRGMLTCNTVVNASGPSAAKIAGWAGIELPVKPYKRQIVTTAPLDFVGKRFPMVVDVGSGLYVHKESGGLLLGWANPNTESGFDESTDPEYTDEILVKGLNRIPQLEVAKIKTAWGGLYAVTPDHRAIMGECGGFNGFYHAVGFSGHGFMHAPAVGIVLSESICGKEPSIDISALAMDRFQKKLLATESTVI